MISSRFVFVLLAILVIVAECTDYRSKVPKDPAMQLKLKKRGQACMKRILPKTPAAQAVQTKAAQCFNVDCALGVIDTVEKQFPQEFPTLKGCMGY